DRSAARTFWSGRTWRTPFRATRSVAKMASQFKDNPVKTADDVALCFPAPTSRPQKTEEKCDLSFKNSLALLKMSLAAVDQSAIRRELETWLQRQHAGKRESSIKQPDNQIRQL